eukprot:g31989.t1
MEDRVFAGWEDAHLPGFGAQMTCLLRLMTTKAFDAGLRNKFSRAAWYGAKDEKWKQLKEQLLCHFRPSNGFLDCLEASSHPRCMFARGLVEWALSVHAAHVAFDGGFEDFVEISYEDLLQHPDQVLDALEASIFGSAAEGAAARAWARDVLRSDVQEPVKEAEQEVLDLLHGSGLEGLIEVPWTFPGVGTGRPAGLGVATLNSSDLALPETISTCRFAQRVANVQTFARVNEQQDPQLVIASLRQENAQLKAAIGGQGGEALSEEELRKHCQSFLEDASDLCVEA